MNEELKNKAKNWVHQNVVLAEHCGIEYSDLEDRLFLLLKEQDRDTRHACANAINKIAADHATITYACNVVMNSECG